MGDLIIVVFDVTHVKCQMPNVKSSVAVLRLDGAAMSEYEAVGHNGQTMYILNAQPPVEFLKVIIAFLSHLE